jgi:hypothetical protein
VGEAVTGGSVTGGPGTGGTDAGGPEVEPTGPAPEPGRPPEPGRSPRRPLIERLGLGFIALVAAALFGAMSAAAWAGGELFLAVMAGIGLLMTLWAAATTVFRA